MQDLIDRECKDVTPPSKFQCVPRNIMKSRWRSQINFDTIEKQVCHYRDTTLLSLHENKHIQHFTTGKSKASYFAFNGHKLLALYEMVMKLS